MSTTSGDTSTTADGATTTTAGLSATTVPGAAITPDETVPDSNWSANASAYADRIGIHVGYHCPPDGTLGSLWGTGPFTGDSSVCTAATYAGRITVKDGGDVVIEVAAGLDRYDGGTRNGVTAGDWGSYTLSYTIL